MSGDTSDSCGSYPVQGDLYGKGSIFCWWYECTGHGSNLVNDWRFSIIRFENFKPYYNWQANEAIEDDTTLRIFIAINLLSLACIILKEMDIELMEADTWIELCNVNIRASTCVLEISTVYILIYPEKFWLAVHYSVIRIVSWFVDTGLYMYIKKANWRIHCLI